MLERLLPRTIDNVYRGHRLALWLFVPVVALKMAIALGTIFNGRTSARMADGIPLDSFGAAGAEAVVALFAIWGLAQLVFGALGVLALTRYRAMIPFMFTLFTLEHLARRVLLLAHPIQRNPAAGPFINLGLLAMMLVGLALSLRGPVTAGSAGRGRAL